MKKITLFILILSIVSCEEPYDLNITEGQETTVIQAIITSKFQKQRLTFYQLNAAENNGEPPKIYVSDGEFAYEFHAVKNTPGLFISDTAFAVTIDKEYSLLIEYKDKIYTAKDQALPVSLPDTVKWQLDTTAGLYKISYVAPVFSPFESAMYILELDWSKLPQYSNMPYDSTHAKMFFFTLQSVDINQLFQPQQQTVYFPEGTEIKETKYSLSPLFAMYIRAMLIETQWSGSLFDTEHWNLPTNISGGAKGFFAVSSVYERTYIVK